MILEFSFTNFRSIKEEQSLSMLASSGSSKADNYFIPEGHEGLKILKSAVIYGPNASGKSNVLLGLQSMQQYITNSTKLTLDEKIPWYQPFRLDQKCRHEPTQFRLDFIGPENKRFIYEVNYNQLEILFEALYYYPGKRQAVLFKREGNQVVTRGKYLPDRGKMIAKILKNNLVLSREGNSGKENLLTEVYRYFQNLVIFDTKNPMAPFLDAGFQVAVQRMVIEDKSNAFRDRLNRLIRIADFGIENFTIEKGEPSTEEDLSIFNEELKEAIQESQKYQTLFNHKGYENNSESAPIPFKIEDESAGTRAFFGLGGFILKILEEQTMLVYDELDTSLHPELTHFLVELFHNPISNPRNVQLIFTTHDTTLLDPELFRKDQIWFTEKNKFGGSRLYCADDFDDLRENAAFEKKYLNGNFGALPKIKKLEFIYNK